MEVGKCVIASGLQSFRGSVVPHILTIQGQKEMINEKEKGNFKIIGCSEICLEHLYECGSVPCAPGRGTEQQEI
jgi:hypothetical protein